MTAQSKRTSTSMARRRRPRFRLAESLAGFAFVLPSAAGILLFTLVPALMALWVSMSDWNGSGSVFGDTVSYVGFENYSKLLVEPGLAQQDFGTAIRNNLYFVAFVVPLQTLVSLVLAVALNRKLKARGFFRTSYYFPSITSSVAVTVLFLYMFSATGVVNELLGFVGVEGPNWIADPRGLIHLLASGVGMDTPPPALQEGSFLGISWWQWLSGPSIAMCVFIVMAIFTGTGGTMLIFLSALQNISGEVDEAAIMDGANAFQRFWRVTVPMLKPTITLVLTLVTIGTWQLFDQIYAGTQGQPAKTTITAAYLSYDTSFNNQRWGQGAAIAFILFLIIVGAQLVQRAATRERSELKSRRRLLARRNEVDA